MRCAVSLPSTTSICKCCYENKDGTATCCNGGVPKGDGSTVSNSFHSFRCSHWGGYLTMFKFQPRSDAHIFLQIQQNMFLEEGYLTREEFSSTFGSGHLFANPVQLMKSKSFRHRFMVVVVVPVVMLVVLMLMELRGVSRLSKCSHRGGVFDNVQISTTLRCAFLLANPRKHVLLGGIFDKVRIFIHIQIWLSFCKSSSGHEGKIASRSVHGCGGGASGGAGGVDADGASGGITTFQMFSHGGVFDNVEISSTLRCAYFLAKLEELVPLGGVLFKQW